MATPTPARWLAILSGVGASLVLVQVGELLVIGLGWASLTEESLVGVFTSLPFVLGLLYSGRWLARSDLPTASYPRIGKRCLAGLATFLAINLFIMVAIPPTDLLQAVGWLKWAGALGGGVGLLIGVFEARAVDHELEAERARIRQQELERQNERLDAFAGVVSHDLRNPLNVAQGRLGAARRERDGEHLAIVAEAHDRMEALIDDLLALAREGKGVTETEPVPLAEIGRTAWRTVETAEATLSVAKGGTVRADRRRLRRLLENLFRNSVEHGSTGPPSNAREDSVEHGSTGSRTSFEDAVEHGGEGVAVTVGMLDDGTGFFVEDDGPGIPPDERERVLEVGYSRAADGTGLGLAIVGQTATAHGWDVAVTEGESGGARFEFTGADVGP